MQKIRVLAVDDHTIVRDGICALLTLAADIEVVGSAANGLEALELVKELQPDIVLMDISMPVMGGLEATRRILKEFPRTRVITLTQYSDRQDVFPMVEAGARGLVSKSAASIDLVASIRSVYHGDSYLSPSMAGLLVEDFHCGRARHNTDDSYSHLTEREREVLKLVAEGYSTQAIAEMLVVSAKTVEGHRANLMSKLGIQNRVDLVKYALRKGIISL